MFSSPPSAVFCRTFALVPVKGVHLPQPSGMFGSGKEGQQGQFQGYFALGSCLPAFFPLGDWLGWGLAWVGMIPASGVWMDPDTHGG